MQKHFLSQFVYVCSDNLEKDGEKKSFRPGHNTKLIYWPSNCINFLRFCHEFSRRKDSSVKKNLHTMKKSNSIPFNGRNNNNRNESLKNFYMMCRAKSTKNTYRYNIYVNWLKRFFISNVEIFIYFLPLTYKKYILFLFTNTLEMIMRLMILSRHGIERGLHHVIN